MSPSIPASSSVAVKFRKLIPRSTLEEAGIDGLMPTGHESILVDQIPLRGDPNPGSTRECPQADSLVKRIGEQDPSEQPFCQSIEAGAIPHERGQSGPWRRCFTLKDG